MLWFKLQPLRLRLRTCRETSIKPKLTLVPPLPNQRINQQQIRLGRSHNIPPIRRNVYPQNRVSKRRQSRLGVLPYRIEQSDIALFTRDRKFPRSGRSHSRELVFADVLLELALDEFRTRHTGVDTEECVVGCADEGLFASGWGKFVVWRDVAYFDILVDFPFFNDFATFDVEIVQGV